MCMATEHFIPANDLQKMKLIQCPLSQVSKNIEKLRQSLRQLMLITALYTALLVCIPNQILCSVCHYVEFNLIQ